MQYRFWLDASGRSPVKEEWSQIQCDDWISGTSYGKHLEKLKKYGYEELTRHEMLKKLKGANPYKIHELRFMLPKKIARTFCIVSKDSTLWLLHLMIKKRERTLPSDIHISEQRAKLLNQNEKYL